MLLLSNVNFNEICNFTQKIKGARIGVLTSAGLTQSWYDLVLLLAEVAALGQTSLTTGWSAKDHVATGADSGDLGV